MYVGNNYAETYGLRFTDWRHAGMSSSYILSLLFPAVNFIAWVVSYANGDALYLFYFWSQITNYYYISAYWLGPFFMIIWLGVRTNPSVADDNTPVNLAMLCVLGAFTVFINWMFREAFDNWMIKWLYVHAGVKDAKLRVQNSEVPLWGDYDEK